MKNTILKASVLALALSLGVTACSTNTRDQNTVLGAGAGAIIGGGAAALAGGTGWAIAGVAAAGALIGGYIGHQMDSTDTVYVYKTMAVYPVHHVKTWKNKRTHMSYRVVPTSRMMTVNGNAYCRTYDMYSTNMLNGKTTMTKGTACRQANGTWVEIR